MCLSDIHVSTLGPTALVHALGHQEKFWAPGQQQGWGPSSRQACTCKYYKPYTGMHAIHSLNCASDLRRNKTTSNEFQTCLLSVALCCFSSNSSAVNFLAVVHCLACKLGSLFLWLSVFLSSSTGTSKAIPLVFCSWLALCVTFTVPVDELLQWIFLTLLFLAAECLFNLVMASLLLVARAFFFDMCGMRGPPWEVLVVFLWISEQHPKQSF